MTDPSNTSSLDIESLIQGFCEISQSEFDHRYKLWEKNSIDQNSVEVIGALLFRQLTLAHQIARSPGIWNGHTAPLILRAMADVHLSLVWIFADPKERSKAFVKYGLGQQKLQLEHRRAWLTAQSPDTEKLEYTKKIIEEMENWLNEQRMDFLIEVNLGSWSGKSARDMAEEANCLDFYNYVYTPFSACVHSQWHHIERCNTKRCLNPLHGMHRVPSVIDVNIDPHYLLLSAKYMRKSFMKFDEFAKIKSNFKSSYNWLCNSLRSDSNIEMDE